MKYRKNLLLLILTLIISVFNTNNIIPANNVNEKFIIGKQLFDNGNFKKAITYFSTGIDKLSKDNKILNMYYLARSYEKTKNIKNAVNIYKNVIKNFPNNYFSELSLNRIKALNPETKIDYNILLTKKSLKKKETNKENVIIKNEELFKNNYNYNDILKKKNEILHNKIKNDIKKDVEKRFKYKNRYLSDNENNISYNTNNNNDVLTYTIKNNESLFEISNKFYKRGVYYKRLAKYNNISNITNIKEGQIIKIPPYSQIIKNFNESKPVKSDVKTQNIKQISKKLPKQNDFILAKQKFNKKLFIDSINYFKNYIEKGTNKINLEYSYFKIAETYQILGQFNKSAEYFILFISKFKDSPKISRVYYNLANVLYEGLGEKEIAKKYYMSALNKSKDVNLSKLIKQKINNLNSPLTINQKKKKSLNTITFNNTEFSEIILSEKDLITKLNEYTRNDLKDELPKKNIKPIKNKNISENERDKSISVINPKSQTLSKKTLSGNLFNNKNVDEYISEGYKYKKMGMYEEAIRIYKTAINKFPNNPTAYNNLAYLYSDLEVNLVEAMDLCKTAIALDPLHKGFYLDTLGWLHYKNKDFLNAKKTLEQSIFYKPTAIRKFHLAQVYLKLNLKVRAILEFQEALVLQPHGKLSEKIKNNLLMLKN